MKFSNNLEKNDRVFDTVSQRQGKVQWTPRNTSQRRTAVLIDGHAAPIYLDVMQLRLIVNQVPEPVPPVDGEPEREPEPKPTEDHKTTSALEILKAERARNAEEMTAMERRFAKLKTDNEKLDRAIAVLAD